MNVAPKPFDYRRLELYRLHVSYACPWCHRCLIARALCGLSALRVTHVEPVMDEQGWRVPGCGQMSDVYRRFGFGRAGRATVPLLVDEGDGTAISNDSGEIMRLLGQAGGACSATGPDLIPLAFAAQIDETNAFVQTGVNEKVYRVGFADGVDEKCQAERELAAQARARARAS
ncbi:MAG: glutathione S-transferase N-terminal domain-containing protein [Chitinophagaceae bacterium]|nr:glutathione S-transferase N-terminal domain-containing protein [Rubrivivax sp.]